METGEMSRTDERIEQRPFSANRFLWEQDSKRFDAEGTERREKREG
jgi:hypothetical protein